MLVNTLGEPVKPVLRYIKFKDNTGAARNTLRAYCYNLKLFFEFLKQESLSYYDIGIDEMAIFMRWLQNPYRSLKVSPIKNTTMARTARTINTVISTVIGFYDYLYHINKNKSYDAKILKLKRAKEKAKDHIKRKY